METRTAAVNNILVNFVFDNHFFFLQPQSDLLELVQVLIIVFGESCPVYSVSAQAPPPINTGPRPQSNLPYPVQGQGEFFYKCDL